MSSQYLLLESLSEFYDHPYYQSELVNIIDGTKGISLRSIDWFITNYSKKNNNFYLTYERDGLPTMSEEDSVFRGNMNVHQSYKSQLKSYSKKTFDPFCRRDRILFKMGNNEVETTIGQLNFFRWALENLVVEYICQNKEIIEKDMNKCLKKIKEKSQNKTGVRKPREELSLSATRGLSKTNLCVEITFD